MPTRYATPRELIDALHNRVPGAREALARQVRDPLERLMQELAKRHRLSHDADALTRYALHAAETYLRTRSPAEFASLNWTAFRGTVLLHAAKQAFHPFGGQPGPGAGPEPLPDAPPYQHQTLFQPSEKVGGYWFGGDWFGGFRAADGSLWVLVADVTGHGYYAYLLASGLPDVWQACWRAARSQPREPVELLAAMHQLLEECMPEGVYVECTLARLDPSGEATVAPAGGSRVLLRRRGQPRPDLHKLRGGWLGLLPPLARDQRTYTLADGDELILATDGLYEQLFDVAGDDLISRLDAGDRASLFDLVGRLLGDSLRRGPQLDDITLVLLRRRSDGGPRDGASDVPV